MEKLNIENAIILHLNFSRIDKNITDEEKENLFQEQRLVGIRYGAGTVPGDIHFLNMTLVGALHHMWAGQKEKLVPDFTIPGYFKDHEEELKEYYKSKGIVLTFVWAPPGQIFSTPGGGLKSDWMVEATTL